MHADATDLRLTPQRRAVLGVLMASDDHPNAAEVFARVQARAPGIGAATVYRSLAHLVSTGWALELNFGNGSARFDANTTHHDHLVCDECGCAVDIPADDAPIGRDADRTIETQLGTLGSRALDIAARKGFDVTAYDLRFRGRCSNCRGTAANPPTSPYN